MRVWGSEEGLCAPFSWGLPACSALAPAQEPLGSCGPGCVTCCPLWKGWGQGLRGRLILSPAPLLAVPLGVPSPGHDAPHLLASLLLERAQHALPIHPQAPPGGSPCGEAYIPQCVPELSAQCQCSGSSVPLLGLWAGGGAGSPAHASVPSGDGTLHLPKPVGQPQLPRRR